MNISLSLFPSVSLTLSLLKILRRRRLKRQPQRRCVWLYAHCFCVSFLVHVSVRVCVGVPLCGFEFPTI